MLKITAANWYILRKVTNNDFHHPHYIIRYLKFANSCISIRFKQINQPDAIISQVYYLTFTRMYSSTCFGRPHAHHQELNNCSSSLWFYHWSVVVVVFLVVVARPRPRTLLPPRSNGKTRGCYCSCWVPDDGREGASKMLSCTYE